MIILENNRRYIWGEIQNSVIDNIEKSQCECNNGKILKFSYTKINNTWQAICDCGRCFYVTNAENEGANIYPDTIVRVHINKQ